MGKWVALCGWEDGSPNEACLSAVRQGRALSAAEASGLSCESIPPPEIEPKDRMIADRRNRNDRRQRRQSRMPLGIRVDFSEITP